MQVKTKIVILVPIRNHSYYHDYFQVSAKINIDLSKALQFIVHS
ncbi:hypothetical protein [Vibrio gallaecicus]|nr:hypothetical protein [Vibrio gallaecicus]MDN3615770.1 hypothetical protein [Vibrio gallaecicus]MDN3615898.1 hypothetical protein [Vibrio gallaecicus]MDN3617738.1 hypothetical protein [Vibrio gallaecicus]